MQSFKEYVINEKYSFIPKSTENILKSNLPNVSDVVAFYSDIRKETDMEDPIAINMDNPKQVKIHRDLDGMFDLSELKKKYSLSITYGNGSRGNRGANNRGNFFETVLAGDIELYIETRDEGADYVYKDFMREFISSTLSKHRDIQVKIEGGLNKPRPLRISGSKIRIQNDTISDIGATVTDITVLCDGQPYYLSLKLGSTITLFNVGVTKYLTAKDIEIGKITNRQGASFLDLFGIDHKKYIETFQKYDPKSGVKNQPEYENVMGRVNTREIETFLETGIGYGYYFVHAKNAKPGAPIHYMYMDKATAQRSVKIQSMVVKYPKPGSAKRIDIQIETPNFSFKVNIRNKQGGVTPTHIMCDYKFK
jgi:hypothetical protein